MLVSFLFFLLEKANEHMVLLHNCKYNGYQMCAFMHSFIFVHALGKSSWAKGVDNTSSPICHLRFLSYSIGYLPTAPPINVPHTAAAAWKDSIPLIFLSLVIRH